MGLQYIYIHYFGNHTAVRKQQQKTKPANFSLVATIRRRGTRRLWLCPMFHLSKANERGPKQVLLSMRQL